MKNNQPKNKMNRESLLKIYVGNKLLGSNFPVLVVVGDNTWEKNYFGEHYLFADVAKLPFVFRRNVVSPENARLEYFDFDAYPEIFSAESLLNNQFTAARAHLEAAFSSLDMKAYKEIFWEGRPFEFSECKSNPLVQFHIFGKHTTEMASMFEFSRSKILRELNHKLSALPKIKIEEDYGDAKR
jgi:hypothetical protein